MSDTNFSDFCPKPNQNSLQDDLIMRGVAGEEYPIGHYRARREWVGLTDDEVSAILDREIGFNSCWGPETDFARAIEAKLKEKNA